MYAIHLIEIYGQKNRLKKELIYAKTKTEDTNPPKAKTLKSLWEIHGLDRYNYTHDEQINLLSKWIIILYGKNFRENKNP